MIGKSKSDLIHSCFKLWFNSSDLALVVLLVDWLFIISIKNRLDLITNHNVQKTELFQRPFSGVFQKSDLFWPYFKFYQKRTTWLKFIFWNDVTHFLFPLASWGHILQALIINLTALTISWRSKEKNAKVNKEKDKKEKRIKNEIWLKVMLLWSLQKLLKLSWSLWGSNNLSFLKVYSITFFNLNQDSVWLY